MDFALTESEQALVGLCRDFAQNEIGRGAVDPQPEPEPARKAAKRKASPKKKVARKKARSKKAEA